MSESMVPSPEAVRAAREHLTARFAGGLDRLLWEESKHPLPDVASVNQVLAAADRGERLGDADFAAALVALYAARLDLDHKEFDLIEEAQAAGMNGEQLAAVLQLPSASAAAAHAARLKGLRTTPVDHVPDVIARTSGAERAQKAEHRAQQAAQRAAAAAARRAELSKRPSRQAAGSAPGGPSRQGAEGDNVRTGSAADRRPARVAQARAEEAEYQRSSARRLALMALIGVAEAYERAAAAFERLASTKNASVAGDYLGRATEHRAMAVQFRAKARREASVDM